jgi:hypothetical protein
MESGLHPPERENSRGRQDYGRATDRIENAVRHRLSLGCHLLDAPADERFAGYPQGTLTRRKSKQATSEDARPKGARISGPGGGLADAPVPSFAAMRRLFAGVGPHATPMLLNLGGRTGPEQKNSHSVRARRKGRGRRLYLRFFYNGYEWRRSFVDCQCKTQPMCPGPFGLSIDD